MEISIESAEFCEETNFASSSCPSPEVEKVLNMNFLTINGRFTPRSARSSACSTRSVSLSTTPIPPDEDDDVDEDDEATGDTQGRNSLRMHRLVFETSGRTTPVFTWNPLPTGNSIVYAKNKDNEVKFSRVKLTLCADLIMVVGI